MNTILTLVESGGLVAFAVVIWFELRLFRTGLTKAVSDIGQRQVAIMERQKVIADGIDEKLKPKLKEVSLELGINSH